MYICIYVYTYVYIYNSRRHCLADGSATDCWAQILTSAFFYRLYRKHTRTLTFENMGSATGCEAQILKSAHYSAFIWSI